jgi:hypothetical protein
MILGSVVTADKKVYMWGGETWIKNSITTSTVSNKKGAVTAVDWNGVIDGYAIEKLCIGQHHGVIISRKISSLPTSLYL